MLMLYSLEKRDDFGQHVHVVKHWFSDMPAKTTFATV
jgi:hypothetical protein